MYIFEKDKKNKEIKEIIDNLSVTQKKVLIDYIVTLHQEKIDYISRCFSALSLIRDNYGVLDKYGIDMLDDILSGK